MVNSLKKMLHAFNKKGLDPRSLQPGTVSVVTLRREEQTAWGRLATH